MKYCSNLRCPHRERVAAPAEFFDHVLRCSDCSTKLVESEEAAIAGHGPPLDPYRAAAALEDEAPSDHPNGGPRRRHRAGAPGRRPNDAATGVALVVAGSALIAGTYALGWRAHGVQVVAWLPLLYGVFALARARAAKI